MKFTLSWLKKHLDTTATLDVLCTKLTAIGLEVEDVEDPGAVFAPFTVCEVLEAKPHPNADRLRVCRVATVSGEVQVVCGAPNARTGMKAVFAPEGSRIPATGDVLKAGVIRGEKSCGMMVSEREMGLSDNHTGIIEAPADAPIGTPLAVLLGKTDPVIEINLTPNRGDCAGVRGIARDLAAAGMGSLKPLAAVPVAGAFPSPVTVRVDDAAACPLFIGRLIRGVKNGPSPQWLQDALTSIGKRSISALVDITNYFTFDLGRPLHVFDAAKISGNVLTVRAARTGETLHALDDKVYALTDGQIVIADSNGPEALAGVMGGLHSGCSDTTTDVFLEVAQFDPVRVARVGRMLGIVSDARYRFERGVDPAAMPDYAELATQMILDLCGGEASALVTVGSVPTTRRTVSLRPDRVTTLGGVDVPLSEQTRILTALGFEIKGDTVTVPSWRPDIHGEADLVEEILRITGFDQIPTIPLPRVSEVAVAALSPAQRRLFVARRTLAARGLLECVSYAFIARKHAELFGGVHPAFVIINPISAEMDVMRPSLLPGLLAAANRNAARGFPDVALCETGAIFTPDAADRQISALATLRAGQAVPRQVQGGARAVDVFDAKADALAALESLGLSGAQITADAPAWYHPGRSGCLRVGNTVVAHFGELHPDVLDVFDLKTGAAACEVFVDRIPLPKAKGPAKPLLKLPAFQPVVRDFAFMLDTTVPADKVVKAIRSVDRERIVDVTVFDDYRGKGLPDGQKSLALSVTLQPQDKTLTDADIEAIGAQIVAAVTKATGATLRG